MVYYKTIKYVFILFLMLSASGTTAQEMYFGPPSDAVSTPNPQVSDISEIDVLTLDPYDLFSFDKGPSRIRGIPLSVGESGFKFWIFEYDRQSSLHNQDARFPRGLGEMMLNIFNNDIHLTPPVNNKYTYRYYLDPSWFLQSYQDEGFARVRLDNMRARSFYKWVKEARKHKTSMPVNGNFVRTLSQESFPVVFYGKTKSMIVDNVYIPGLSDTRWEDYFGEYNPTLVVRIESLSGSRDVTIGLNDDISKVINIKMGDKVTFMLTSASLPQDGPKIFGVPQTWIANLSGESRYYCSPSVTPGEFNPWLGYDSNVHGVAMRRYDEYFDFKRNVDEWKGSETITWSWTAQRRMSADKKSYTPPHSWNKEKTSPVQRNNQKAGLNMELLRAFKGWSDHSNSRLGSYTGSKYLLGLDPDEILYLNYPYSSKKTSGERVLLAVKDEPWKVVTRDETLPVVNEIVTAYRKNRENHINDFVGHVKDYDGYEIMDKGTSADYPTGTGTGNSVAPGYVAVELGRDLFKMKFNVTAPLQEDNGFYKVVEGTQYPAQGGEASYSINGLSSNTNLNGFSLEYMNVGGTGKVTRTTFYLRDESSSVKTEVAATGIWQKEFNISKSRGYNTITAYYQRTSDAERVIIGGKELLEIQLRFFEVEDRNRFFLDKGKGDGGNIYKSEFRNERGGEYTVLRGSKYAKPYVRNYTARRSDKYKFHVLDSDPHTFNQGGTEWYLSERLQAKKIPDDSLNVYLNYYSVKDGDSSPSKIGSGKDMDFTWNYSAEDVRNNVVQKISAVYNTNPSTDYNIGDLNTITHHLYTEYSHKTASVISLVTFMKGNEYPRNRGNDKKLVFKLDAINTTFAYDIGERAYDEYTEEPNRFSKYNDLKIYFKWQSDHRKQDDLSSYTYAELHGRFGGSITSPIPRIPPGYFVDPHSFSYDDGGEHKDNFNNWFPSSWVRHYSGEIPSDVPKNDLKRVGGDFSEGRDILDGLFEEDRRIGGDSYEAWQHRFEWIAITPYQGPRVRTNFKAVYDMQAFFDNDTGAFSGTPVLPKNIPLTLITDDQQNMEDMYRGMCNGEYGIYYYNTLGGGDERLFLDEFDIVVKAKSSLSLLDIEVADYLFKKDHSLIPHDIFGNSTSRRDAPDAKSWVERVSRRDVYGQFGQFGKLDYLITPNPVESNSLRIMLRIAEGERGYMDIKIIDPINGKSLLSSRLGLSLINKGEASIVTIPIPPGTLTSGNMYILSIITPLHYFKKKIFLYNGN